MKNKIKIIIKAPGKRPYEKAIDGSARSLRKLIGRDIRALRYDGDACVICAKDNRDLDYNCEWFGCDFYGTVIWIGYSEKHFTSFPDEFREFRTLNPFLFEEFEREKKKLLRNIGEIIGTFLCALLWGWIGFEIVRQLVELL